MGKHDFQQIYQAAASALGQRPRIKLSTCCDTYNPRNRYAGMIIYHSYGQFKWRQRPGQGLAAGHRGMAFYVLILRTDHWPVSVLNENTHDHLYQQYFNMHHSTGRACCGGFSVNKGHTEYSSSVLNGSGGSVHGLSWQSDGSHALSAHEQSVVDVAIYAWKHSGGPGCVAEVPDWLHEALTAPLTNTDAATAPPTIQPPGCQASTEERMDFLHFQLDLLAHSTPILNGLVLQGDSCTCRFQGGQAIVQMAKSNVNGVEYAIKFFASRATFDAESVMYAERASPGAARELAQFLPQVRNVEANIDGSLVDPRGHPLPPCIVMERGESLDHWAARAKPERFMALAMVHQLATRMRAFHALGYVHRDLKPGNVMWLPRENRWTVIDFGCIARTGERARMGFSVAYAAPEVIAAYRSGECTIIAQEAQDVWSLGVMAFELLTGQIAISMSGGRELAMDCIQGISGQQLPWEGDTLTYANRKKLGAFKQSILALLERDPKHRPSMAEFCDECNGLIAGSITVES